MSACSICGALLPPQMTGRPRRFCEDCQKTAKRVRDKRWEERHPEQVKLSRMHSYRQWVQKHSRKEYQRAWYQQRKEQK